MKHAIIALAFSVISLVAPGAVSAQGVSPNITGDWVVQITGDQLLVGTLHFTQVGDTVVGSAEGSTKSGNGVLQISGTLNAPQLSGKWRSPKGEVGWITLNFQPGFKAFSGQWGYSGRKPNGTIVSRKFVATPF